MLFAAFTSTFQGRIHQLSQVINVDTQVNAVLLGTAPLPECQKSTTLPPSFREPRVCGWCTLGLSIEKTPHLENFSYLKVFITVALQVSLSHVWLTKTRGKDTGDTSWDRYIICMTFVRAPQSFPAGIGVLYDISPSTNRTAALPSVILLSSF